MTIRFLLLSLFLFMVMAAVGQEINKQQADSMLIALKKSKKDIHRINLLLHLAQYHIFKGGEKQIDFDSAIVLMSEATTLNKTLKSSSAHGFHVLTESYLVKEKGNKEEGQKLAEKAVAILETTDNKYYLGRARYELSMYYGYEQVEIRLKKIALVEQAVDAFKQAGELERNAYSLEMLGELYLLHDNIPKSIELLKQALAAYESIKKPSLQGVYILLGQAHQFKQDEARALFYMLKALKTAHAVGDTSMQLCQINNALGILYLRIDRKDMCVKYLHDALEIAKKYKDEYSILLLATNISVPYNDMDMPAEALKALEFIPASLRTSKNSLDRTFIGLAYLRTYTKLKQYDKAKPYCDTLLNFARSKTMADQTRWNIYYMVALYYVGTGQYAKARLYLTKNNNILNKVKYEPTIIRDARLWYIVDSAQGNFRAAFNHLHYYKTKMDSLFSANRVKQQQVLSIEYETAMKEDSIKLKDKDISLLTQENNLQEANLRQASLVKNITIAGIGLAGIFLGLLYRQYRHKQKSNTIITHKNEQLEHFLAEKEWLLKEIHHRVKNNLQIVMSLLNSQSAYIDSEPALAAIHDSQHRVHAMSLIHQKLYNTENVSSIDMSFYIRELVSYLADSFSTGQRIRFEFDIEPIEMDVSQAVPLGLILNEAITNSIKYAFPDERSGVISLSLSRIAAHQCILYIADNGIGMPTHLTNKKPGSLGMSLMAGLSEDLDGKFSIENNNGTTIRISFAHDLGMKRTHVLTTSPISSN